MFAEGMKTMAENEGKAEEDWEWGIFPIPFAEEF